MRRLLLILAALGLSAIPALAQIQPVALPTYQWFDDDGSPLAGGKACTYAAGTTTPLATYSDSAGTIQPNPIILDSAGRAVIWFSAASYKIVVRTAGTDNTCSTGSVVWSADNIPGAGQSVASNAWSSVTAATNANSGTFAMSGNTLDLSGATIKVTHGAGTAPTVSAIFGYDDTANKWVFGVNGTAKSFGLAAVAACATHNFVSSPATAIAAPGCSQPAASDLSNGTTGSGAAVLATSPALVTPSIGGTTITNVPVMAWSGYASPTLGLLTNGVNPIDTTGGIEILNFRMTLQTVAVGCSTLPTMEIYDETASAAVSGTTLAMGNGTGAYLATVNANVATGHVLDFRANGVAIAGCSTAPDGFALAATYRMQ